MNCSNSGNPNPVARANILVSSRTEMQTYQETNGDSGIAAYRVTPTTIVIAFEAGGVYLYNHAHPGRQHVEAMQKLAAAGDGLNTYINQHVRDNYARKLS